MIKIMLWCTQAGNKEAEDSVMSQVTGIFKQSVVILSNFSSVQQNQDTGKASTLI